MKYFQILLIIGSLQGAMGSNLLPLTGSSQFQYLNGNYVSVTSNGIVFSSDGLTWSEISAPLGTGHGSLAYCKGLYLYSNSEVTWTSVDLVHFESAPRFDFLQLGSDGNRFLMTTSQGLFTSPDGRTWTRQGEAAYSSFVHANGITVAVSYQGIGVSHGDSFELNTNTPRQLTQVVAIPGLFLARDVFRKVSTSVDGIKWTHLATPEILLDHLTSAGPYFYTHDHNTLARSQDGIHWETIAAHFPVIGFASNGEEILMLDTYLSRIQADGSLTRLGMGYVYTSRVNTYKDYLFIWGTSCFATSNGKDWTEIPELHYSTDWLALDDRVLTWNESMIWVSQDGLHWQEVASPVGKIQTIVQGPDGLLIFGTTSYEGCFRGSSTDGLNWTVAQNDCAAIIPRAFNGSSYLGTNGKLQTSTDAINWTQLDFNVSQVCAYQGVFLVKHQYGLNKSSDGLRFQSCNLSGTPIVAGGFWRPPQPENEFPTGPPLPRTWTYSIDGSSWVDVQMLGTPVAKWHDQLVILDESLVTRPMPSPPKLEPILPWVANASDKELIFVANGSDQAQDVTLNALDAQGELMSRVEHLPPGAVLARTPGQLFPELHNYSLQVSSPSAAVQLGYQYADDQQASPVRLPALAPDQTATKVFFGPVTSADLNTLVYTVLSTYKYSVPAYLEVRDLEGQLLTSLMLGTEDQNLAYHRPQSWDLNAVLATVNLPEKFSLSLDTGILKIAAVLLARNPAGQLNIAHPVSQLRGTP